MFSMMLVQASERRSSAGRPSLLAVRISVEIIDGGHEAILEFLLGWDADVAQDGAGEFGKEALDEIEPGAVLGSESEFETVCGLTGEPSSGLFGDMRGMIVEDQLDRRVGRIGGVEKLEESLGYSRQVNRKTHEGASHPDGTSEPVSFFLVLHRAC
jgi:hypothetical protein